MKNLFKILLLFFLIPIFFQYCDKFDYNKPIDPNVDIKILKENKEQAIENVQAKMDDIFDNININLTDQEKNIIKVLLFFKLHPKKIEFSLENLTISYNKVDHSYRPDYYLHIMKENPSLEEKIKQVTKEIFKTSLHLNEDHKPVKFLPLRGSDQGILIDYMNPFNETHNDFLKDDNIDVNINFQDGNITIIFKKTYIDDFLKNTSVNDLLRKANSYHILKYFVMLPTEFLTDTDINTSDVKAIGSHGLVVLKGIIFDNSSNLDILDHLKTTINTEFEKGIDYKQNGTLPEAGSLLHTLIYNTILKSGDILQLKSISQNLTDDFSIPFHSSTANINKIYLMNGHLVVTLYINGSAKTMMEWLEIPDSFITSLPEKIVPGTFSSMVGNENNIQKLDHGISDYTGDFSESLTTSTIPYLISQNATTTSKADELPYFNSVDTAKIVRFRVRNQNIPIALNRRVNIAFNLNSFYDKFINHFFVFDKYFVTIQNVFGENASESFTNLSKIAPSLAQLYVFRNLTYIVPFTNSGSILICSNISFSILNKVYYYFSTDINPNGNNTDLTFGITSKIKSKIL